MKVTARTIELTGTNYEIGQKLGELTKELPPLAAVHTAGMEGFDEEEVAKAKEMFNRWCPGLTEELEGFAQALGVAPAKVVFYGMTCLRPRPRCSQIALTAARAACGSPLLARNYEFSHEAEDFCLVKTSVRGKHTHMGTSVLHFGRDDGFNEQGLAVSMSSCGFPVGPMPYMRAPRLVGLQFWAVIRTLLENCKDVAEALQYVKEMPIAYNLNMMLVDQGGHIALVETLDGRQAVKRLDEQPAETYLHATNHPVLPELVPLEPKAMRHSLLRYQWVQEQLAGNQRITEEKLKSMLLAEFPQGLCCHYYQDFFGTTKSMVINPAHGTINLCWGGDEKNGWHKYSINAPLQTALHETELRFEKFPDGMGEYLPLA